MEIISHKEPNSNYYFVLRFEDCFEMNLDCFCLKPIHFKMQSKLLRFPEPYFTISDGLNYGNGK